MWVKTGRPAQAGRDSAVAGVARRFVAPTGSALLVIASIMLIGARPSARESVVAGYADYSSGSTECRQVMSFAGRPALYTIDLQPDQPGVAGSGTAVLTPTPSPFGIPLTPDGHPMFDVRITVKNLPSPAAFGAAAYVAWASTADLDKATNLGVIGSDQTTTGVMALNKYIILVTAERTPVGPMWKGPVVLRGFSPSTFLANYASHPLFLGGMPPC